MKIETRRYWDHTYVRELCIRNNWYTCGDNTAYQKMLDYVDNHKPTPTSIYKVALDIKSHSNIDESVCHMMDDIEKYCVNTFYYLPEETEVE